jgi:hypothetical protein
MMDLFKFHNPEWNNTKCIMADKDMVERMVLKEALPQADLLLCSYHVLRTFRTQITTQKMQITGDQRRPVLE